MKFAHLIYIALLTLTMSCASFAQKMDLSMDEKIGLSATEWRHMYFAGISKQPLSQIDLSEPQMSGLLSAVNLNAVISCGTAIEPQYIINKKGTTPWLAMYVLVQVNDPEALNLIANGKTRIHIPSNFIHGAFGNHINWPVEILKSYDLSLGEYHVFAIPFLVHKNTGPIGTLNQSMKVPDGSLEIFGIHELVEGNPEGLLKEFANLVSFIKGQRADAIQ